NFYSDISLPGRLAERAEASAAPFFPTLPFGGVLRKLAREGVKKAPSFLGLPPKHDERECLRDLEERRKLVGRLFERVDRFIAPSKFLADRLKQAGLPREKLLVSDYGFADGLKAAPKISSLPLRVGYVGTLVPHKGLHVLVEAFAHLKGVPAKLSLFGDPGAFPSYTALLRAKAKNLPVSFEGGFDPARRTEILSKVDLLVLPSIWWENSPLTIHEAFLAKIPVLVPRLGAFPELVREEIDGLFYEPGDPRSLAAQIRDFCESKNLRNKLRPDPSRVKAIEKDADWTIRLYEELRSIR
ncbi:MAG: glycosyltransferase, partial [Bdellovibrionota bacterium]